MKHVIIELTDDQQSMLEQFASRDGHGSVHDYVAALIDADARSRAQRRLEELLLEGLQGPETEWTDADSERLMRLAATGR